MPVIPPGIPDDVRAWIEARVRERGPVPLTERIFRHGLQFHGCALRCLELRDGQTFLFQPALVLLAFTIEIYLKGLLVDEGNQGQARGHNLSKLYECLGAGLRHEIAARYADRHHGQQLANDLPGYSDLFIKLRYAYEIEDEHQVDMSGVGQLASALYESWSARHPALIEPGLVHDRIVAAEQGIPILAYANPA